MLLLDACHNDCLRSTERFDGFQVQLLFYFSALVHSHLLRQPLFPVAGFGFQHKKCK